MTETLAQKIEGYQSIEELGVFLNKQNYNPKLVQEYLGFDRRGTTHALLYEMENGRINLQDEPGKTVWKNVLRHYDETGLSDELFDLKMRLHPFAASYLKLLVLGIISDSAAAIIPFITLGTITTREVYKRMLQKKQHRDITKVLSADK